VQGHALQAALLDVKYKGRSIHDVLNMTVREAQLFFASVNRIASKLRVLDDVGLGYLRLGQSATTLSVAKHSASNWRFSFETVAGARCTFSMSRRPGFTSMTSTSCLRRFAN